MTLQTKKTKLVGKTFVGTVSSDKMTSTIVVVITSKYRHPVYKKIVTKKHKVYVQNNLKARLGDQVLVKETRPISRTKRFTTLKIIKKS